LFLQILVTFWGILVAKSNKIRQINLLEQEGRLGQLPLVSLPTATCLHGMYGTNLDNADHNEIR